MGDHAFTGFPEAGLRFLADLAHNNNRDWFEANKQTFIDQVQAPAVALVAALGARLQAISEDIVYDTRRNGSGSLTRIYRDIRFSADKTPYKTHIDLLFWHGPGKKTERPMFGLRFDADGGGLLTGMFRFPKPVLTAYREAVADDRLGDELVAALDAVRSAGAYEIGRQHYKRVPQGYDPEHPRADLLRHDALYAIYSGFDRATLTGPDLVEACYEQCRKTAPLFNWLVKIAPQ